MDNTDQKTEFEKLCARAKRNGQLRAIYPDHGIAIIAVPPPLTVDAPPPAAAPTSPPQST